jgi:hypothetical protein
MGGPLEHCNYRTATKPPGLLMPSRIIGRGAKYARTIIPGGVMSDAWLRGTLAVVCAVLASCGGGGGDDGSGGGGPTVLFEDDFSSGDLSKWVVNVSSPAVEGGYGNAAPSVLFYHAPNASNGGKITANTNFTGSGGLTLTLQVSNRATAGEGGLQVHMQTDNGQNTCQAFFNAGRTSVYYQLQNGLAKPQATNAITADSNWHTYVLAIGTDGAMTWYRDGSPQIATPAYSGCTANINVLKLQIYLASIYGSNADEFYYNVDNVQVTRP